MKASTWPSASASLPIPPLSLAASPRLAWSWLPLRATSNVRGFPNCQDLGKHNFMIYTLATRRDEVALERDGTTETTRVHGNLRVDNGDYIAAAALAGHGISVLPTFIVGEHLQRGELVHMLEEWTIPSLGIHAVYAQTRSLPAKTRVLIDFLVERFGPQPYWDWLGPRTAALDPAQESAMV
jgi:DNA-binding transcriptional LysR family regulator